MNDLQIFNNEKFGKIRTVEIDGQPWFCLADVCKPLGLKTYHCKDRLKKNGIVTNEVVDSAGKRNRMLFVNEGNLYRAIFQSKKEEAEAFTDWVTEEVLPALRKTGTYTTPAEQEKPKLAFPDGVSLNGLARLISVTRRVMLDMGNSPVEIGAMTKTLFDTCGIPVPVAFTKQIPGQLCLFDGPVS